MKIQIKKMKSIDSKIMKYSEDAQFKSLKIMIK